MNHKNKVPARKLGTIRGKGSAYPEMIEQGDFYDDEPIEGVDN